MTNSSQADQLHRRTVAWVDHLTAKIFAMGLTGVSSNAVHAHLSSSHLHHHANATGSGHVKDDPVFLAAIVKSIAACDEVLILGPGNEKTALTHQCNRCGRKWSCDSDRAITRRIGRSSLSVESISASPSRGRKALSFDLKGVRSWPPRYRPTV